MTKSNDSKEHPEVKNIKDICNVSAGSKSTKNVCDKVKKDSVLKSDKKQP